MVEIETLARQFIEAIPHARALGLDLVSIDAGRAVISMPYDEKLIGDPKTGVIHGGAVSAMLDTCCGAAVMSHPSRPGQTATIDLRIDYMRAATPGQTLVATAECYHVARSVAFVRATAVDDRTDVPVASVAASFTAERS
ncbi:MAG: thioesterase [Rhodobacteraceae bacterium]|nr:thioesterase [Paracoccaceae bacterium]